MASEFIENLKARRLIVSQKLRDMEADNAPGSKPNLTNTDGGTAIDHQGYKRALYDELKALDEQIRSALDTENLLQDNDPFEIRTYLY